MAERPGTCWQCGKKLSEVYHSINGTPGFYVCDTPGCSENYAENCAREARLDELWEQASRPNTRLETDAADGAAQPC